MGTRADMRVPAIIFASQPIIEALLTDRSLDQLLNVTTLPGIEMAALLMPDAHEGYGFPIGGVAATKYPDGVISPGGIGYDINCGVRLLKSALDFKDIRNHLEDLSKQLYREVPSGMGKGGPLKLKNKEVEGVLRYGAAWAVENGYGHGEDLEFIESNGRLTDARIKTVSTRAKQRGHDQLGTIGSGNHFVEVDRVSEIFDKGVAEAYGIREGQVVILIHTGSRGLGHQNATDYIRLMITEMAGYDIILPDRELACVPFNSSIGQDYFTSMAACANYAWCNRQVITWEIRKVWQNIFGAEEKLDLVYDVAHNIAKLETHVINGEKRKLIVHRKGATRAYGPGFTELPVTYQAAGQPVLIPGSMGTESYVLAGTELSMLKSFGSTCHGAGRRMSRRAARKNIHGRELQDELRLQGIHIQAGSLSGIAEEAPAAYKDVNLVVEAVHQAGIAKKVAKLKPLAVVKG
ncbi:MAG: RtcB family protein [Cyclobacteriaceae bacterium]|nr:RtcB family protein [Cyclobacteriaceae bacterium]